MRRRFVAVLAVALAALAACNALTGIGDLDVGDESGRLPARSDGGSGDASPGAGEGGTTAGGDGSAVTPSLTSCGADQVCITNSDGWTPALSLLLPIATVCPAEWPVKKDVTKAGDGSCQCTCTSKGSACAGPLEARSGGTTCSGTPAPLPFAADGGCTQSNTALPAPVALSGSGSPPAECNGTVVDDLGDPETTVTCAGATAIPSTSCGSGEVCVPKATRSDFPVPTSALCIVHDGEVSCPAKLPLRTIIGTSVNDARSCAATCGCAPSGCNGGTLEAFATATCTQRLRAFDVNGTCNPGAAAGAMSYRYTPPTGCKVTQPAQVVGSVTVEAPRTMCCAFPF